MADTNWSASVLLAQARAEWDTKTPEDVDAILAAAVAVIQAKARKEGAVLVGEPTVEDAHAGGVLLTQRGTWSPW